MFKGKGWKRGLVIAVVVLALTVGTAGVVSAHGGGGWFGIKGLDRDALLAEELGITVEKLQAARQAASTRALDQALEQGLITQEQYDQMKLHSLVAPYLDRQTLLAEALGIEPATLDDKTLSEWMDELDLDQATLQTRLQAAVEAALDRAVADGVITEEQATTLKDEGLPMFGRDFGRGMGPMGHPGRGRFGGEGCHCPGTDSDSDSDTGTLQNNSSWRMRGMGMSSQRF
ncbi:MAG: hypothetical protein KBH71_01650 [Anaerolineae bacterium]|nr:hypothetical protein [Anaerolineae bacterium]